MSFQKFKILFSNNGLNDGYWHTVKIRRERTSLILQVDGSDPSVGKK